MVKAFERPLLLHVGEVVVPLEFSDLGYPFRAKGKKGKYSKRGHNLGAGAGQKIAVDGCTIGGRSEAAPASDGPVWFVFLLA